MKVIEFKNYDNLKDEKKLNKKKLIIASVIIAIIMFVAIITSIYIANSSFRKFMDTYILAKNVKEESLPYIELDETQTTHAYAFDKYIVVLDKNKLSAYNAYTEAVAEFQVNISNPVFCSADNYLVIAEQNSKKAYLMRGTQMVWEKDVDGNISRITVNNSGYVSVIVGGTTYKSVIITYDNNGKELFKTYLSNTIATNLTISNDNKYLSFIEIDTSGALINCKIKTISINEARTSPTNSILYTYEIGLDILAIDLKYQNKDKLLCMCDNSIYLLSEGRSTKLVEFKNGISKISFSGINLDSDIYKIEEIIYGPLNQASNLEIIDTENNKVKLYTIDGIAKNVCSSENVVAANLGTEVYFVGKNGWLIKKYTSTQEVSKVIVTDQIAGIIYRDKIKFLKL